MFLGIPKAIYRAVTEGSNKTPSRTEIKTLTNVSGVIKPGTLTLLLAPPGHGKSTFLRTLAGLVTDKNLKGKISYSGVTKDTAKESGVHLGQLVQYVSQVSSIFYY